MNHGDRRAGKLTGSVAKIVLHGSARAKNTLMRALLNPRKFHVGDTSNMPAPLAWGHNEEDYLRSMFWDQHPEYEFMSGDDATFIDSGSSLWSPPAELPRNLHRYVGTSPDGVLADSAGAKRGMIEIKSPYNPDALRLAISGGWVKRWLPQIDWGMMLTGLPYTWLIIGNRLEPPASPYRYREFLVTACPKRQTRMVMSAIGFLNRWTSGVEYHDDTPMKDAIASLLTALEIVND